MSEITIKSLKELPLAAKFVLEKLGDRNVVALYGSMGAGKTTLISEIARQLGVKDSVSSPTFALVNEYQSENNRSIYHFDFYRINKIEEVYDLGYEEYFYSDGLCFIEWAELIEELLPEDTAILRIETLSDNSRRISIGDF